MTQSGHVMLVIGSLAARQGSCKLDGVVLQCPRGHLLHYTPTVVLRVGGAW